MLQRPPGVCCPFFVVLCCLFGRSLPRTAGPTALYEAVGPQPPMVMELLDSTSLRRNFGNFGSFEKIVNIFFEYILCIFYVLKKIKYVYKPFCFFSKLFELIIIGYVLFWYCSKCMHIHHVLVLVC